MKLEFKSDRDKIEEKIEQLTLKLSTKYEESMNSKFNDLKVDLSNLVGSLFNTNDNNQMKKDLHEMKCEIERIGLEISLVLKDKVYLEMEIDKRDAEKTGMIQNFLFSQEIIEQKNIEFKHFQENLFKSLKIVEAHVAALQEKDHAIDDLTQKLSKLLEDKESADILKQFTSI